MITQRNFKTPITANALSSFSAPPRPLLLFSTIFSMDVNMVERSVSLVYANVNLNQSQDYYEYDNLQVQWG